MKTPAHIKKLVKQEVAKTSSMEEAFLAMLKIAGQKYRNRFELRQYWIGNQERIEARFRGEHNWEASKFRTKLVVKKYWTHGRDWKAIGLEKGVPEDVLEMWGKTWTEEAFPRIKAAREEKERQEQLKDEAYWMALTMKMNEITAVIEKLLYKVEQAADGMSITEFSPRDLKDLVGACEALQKMRNLEEGRPTSLSGKSTLTRSSVGERLKRLIEKGIPVEIDPRLFDFANKNVQ